jgi:hypothetical protein
VQEPVPAAVDPEIGQLSAVVEGVGCGSGQLGSEPV